MNIDKKDAFGEMILGVVLDYSKNSELVAVGVLKVSERVREKVQSLEVEV